MARQIIGIVGGHTRNTTAEGLRLAEEVGVEIGRRGLVIVCGGGDGIMEAACRGCRQAGGTTIGILKGNEAREANSFVEISILTSMDVASNNIIVWTAAGLIAFDGRYGTLNEIALALDFGRPLVVVGKNRLLNVSAVKSERFACVDGYHEATAADILDRLLQMMEGNRS